jgi:hypothetical protein
MTGSVAKVVELLAKYEAQYCQRERERERERERGSQTELPHPFFSWLRWREVGGEGLKFLAWVVLQLLSSLISYLLSN